MIQKLSDGLTRYRGSWWSIALPDGWEGYAEESWHTFHARDRLGVLQVSAVRKDSDAVSDLDLLAFAKERLPADTPLNTFDGPGWQGLRAEYRDDGLFWQEWWLRSGHLMLYVTYGVDEERLSQESETVRLMVDSLAPSDW